MVTSAQGRSALFGAVMARTAVYAVRSHAQSSTEPSKAAQSVTILTHKGERALECSATYFTLKSSVKRAASITSTAVVVAKKAATAANRAEVCSLAS